MFQKSPCYDLILVNSFCTLCSNFERNLSYILERQVCSNPWLSQLNPSHHSVLTVAFALFFLSFENKCPFPETLIFVPFILTLQQRGCTSQSRVHQPIKIFLRCIFSPFSLAESPLGKVCIRAQWPIRPELIPVSVA